VIHRGWPATTHYNQQFKGCQAVLEEDAADHICINGHINGAFIWQVLLDLYQTTYPGAARAAGQ